MVAALGPGQLRLVSVIGQGVVEEKLYELARATGRLLAEQGVAVVTGGLGGVMEAACRGACEAGGLTIGILPGPDAGAANRWVRIALPTGLGEARNVLVAGAGRGAIAVGGEVGTLSEIALALKRGLPVVSLDSWDLDPTRLRPDRRFFRVETPEAAVATLLSQART